MSTSDSVAKVIDHNTCTVLVYSITEGGREGEGEREGGRRDFRTLVLRERGDVSKF